MPNSGKQMRGNGSLCSGVSLSVWRITCGGSCGQTLQVSIYYFGTKTPESTVSYKQMFEMRNKEEGSLSWFISREMENPHFIRGKMCKYDSGEIPRMLGNTENKTRQYQVCLWYKIWGHSHHPPSLGLSESLTLVECTSQSSENYRDISNLWHVVP